MKGTLKGTLVLEIYLNTTLHAKDDKGAFLHSLWGWGLTLNPKTPGTMEQAQNH